MGSAPFTGRAAQLNAMDAWAASADPVMVVEAIGGTGKSALTWEWTTTRAAAAIDGLAGRLWWSFYEGSASMTRFLQEVLSYTTRYRWEEIRQLTLTELSAEVLAALRERPFLLVLDGFERLLTAYHRFDPSKLRDEDVPPAERSLIEPHAHAVVRTLTTARPSRVLISSRLMPDALEGRFGQRLPGVTHVQLTGLSDADTVALLARLGVHGETQTINDFFRQLGNHPLLIGIVAGLVRDYRRQPGAFDRWHADPAGGGAFTLPALKLTERQSHILAAALDGLEPSHRRLLGWISVLTGAVDWPTLEAINPFLPGPPAAVDMARAVRRSPEAAEQARALLDSALKDLEDRGLLWWDRSSNTYDLHPIVRAVAHDQLDDASRVQANERISAHFKALPAQEPSKARSVEELRDVISLFRALVGARHFSRALSVWQASLEEPVLVEMGATATAVELLAPLAAAGDAYCRTSFGIALTQGAGYEESLQQDLQALAEWLKDDGYSVDLGLHNVAFDCIQLGRLRSAARYLEFEDASIRGERYRKGATGHALLAARLGQVETAVTLFDEAVALEDDGTFWVESDSRYWRLYFALRAGDSLTEGRLDQADRIADTWLERRNLRQLRRDFFIQCGEPGRALVAAYECDRIERDSGMESVPATAAYILALLGRAEEAAAALDESLNQLPRVDAAIRPHYHLALALRELGQREAAVIHAREAYRLAWGEGPPFCHHWNMLDVKALLAGLGEPEPGLPVIDERTWRVPLEADIRAFISRSRERSPRRSSYRKTARGGE